jgi:hypothetical protein
MLNQRKSIARFGAIDHKPYPNAPQKPRPAIARPDNLCFVVAHGFAPLRSLLLTHTFRFAVNPSRLENVSHHLLPIG